MVFVDRNGRVLEHKPWAVSIAEVFTGLWFAVQQFFMTLVAPFIPENRSSNQDNARRGGWGGGGGGPGGGGGGGGGGGRGYGSGSGGNAGLRPNRRIGRVINTSMDCNIPGGG